jgi:adenylate kinase
VLSIVLISPPGAGKSTQATRLAARFSIPWIATGEILRAAVREGTALGRVAQDFVDQGAMVPDSVVIALVTHRLAAPDCASGFVLDGFPRTMVQAEALHRAGTRIDYVVELSLDDVEAVRRLSGRRIHPASGRTYHVVFQPPKVSDKDDLTGEPLVQRSDDSDDAVRRRLALYHEQTQPVLSYCRCWAARGDGRVPRCLHVSAIGTPDEVAERLATLLVAASC